MMDGRIASIFAFATLSVGTAHAGPFDPPDPRVYAHAEDQERARLRMTPCTAKDVGLGCERQDGRVIRKAPCGYRTAPNVITSLPTDECFKMEAPRTYRGVWVDEFEGERFIPEGASPPEWPRSDPKSPGWREQAERARLATIWIDASRVERQSRQQGTRRFIEFVGRKTMYPGNYGHFGMSGQEIIVDRVISLRNCPASGPCG